MNHFDTKDIERIISLYLDGELEQDEVISFEEFLRNNPAVAREVEILKVAKKAFSSKEKLPVNNWFWLKLSGAIEKKESKKSHRTVLWRPSFAIGLVAVLTVAAIGTLYVKDAHLFNKFFIDKKNQVQNSLMTGNILPLFSNLNKDDVLNFALFGSIALDSSNNTELQVTNSEDKGSQIEIVRKEQRRQIPPVTVSDFCEEVGINKPHQQLIVDSILGTYKQKLQTSVLVSENKEIAIHEQLAELNRAMVSTIAASLEPIQRTKFQKFLEERQAPYSLIAMDAPKVAPEVILQRIPQMSRSNKYVVISKDTVGIAEMRVNLDSIREAAHRHSPGRHPITSEQMLRELAELERQFENNVVITGPNANRVRVYSNNNAFRINLETSSAPPSDFEMVEMVKPRINAPLLPRQMNRGVTVIGDSGFSFEFPADDEALRIFKRLPRGEFRYEIVDSSARTPKMKIMFKSQPGKKEFEAKLKEMKEREHELIDLDSLLRESEKEVNAEKQTPPKKEVKVFDL